jgi:pterin-4a-carbinolamine dehydratase
VWWWTHDADGVTDLDVKAAAETDAAAAASDIGLEHKKD